MSPVRWLMSVTLLLLGLSLWAQCPENASLAPAQWRSRDGMEVRVGRGGYGFWTRVLTPTTVDSYVMTKYAPSGATPSALWGCSTDFNSPPRIRQYAVYVPPLPYTHPPVYAPLPTSVTSDRMSAVEQQRLKAGVAVSLEY